jgi:predicted nucleic acid-binding protein
LAPPRASLTPIVVDDSAIAPLALDEKDAALAAAALRAIVSEGGVVPALFWYEIRNVTLHAESRNRTTAQRTGQFLTDLRALPLTVDFPPDSDAVLEYARRHSLTVYDATYLELTKRTNSQLASHDQSLRAAVLAEGGELL